MTNWLHSLWRCCSRRRPVREVQVLDPENQEQDLAFQRPHRRTYYYSIFAARLAIMVNCSGLVCLVVTVAFTTCFPEIMLAILIALLTILTWHFTTVYTTRSIKALAFSLRTELLNRPIARMWNLLNSTVETTRGQVNLSEFVVGQYSLPINTTAQIALHKTMCNVTWAVFASRATAKTITVAYTNNQLQAFDRNVATNATYYVFTDDSNATALDVQSYSSPAPSPSPDGAIAPSSGSLQDVPLGASNVTWYAQPVNTTNGRPISNATPTPGYDLTQQLKSVVTLKEGEVTWRVTVSDFDDTPLLSSASPVRHTPTGTVVAATGVTTALSSINAFLKELITTHAGYLYLTTADGHLLASSTNTALIDTSGPTRSLMFANESMDPVIRAGAQWLFQRYGNTGLLKQVIHAEDIWLQGSRYYIDTFSLELPRLQLIGVIIIPRSYVMGEVDRRGRATLAILIAISSCILLVGCIFILILTSGVSNEMKLRAELIAHLDARRRAEASSNYKSQFLANMSHELRTPMAAVIGLLDILLCDDCLSSEQVNMVSQIRRCSTALLRLLNNILDISKVESGKLLLEEADFDLNKELEGLVDMFSVQCRDKNIEIVLDLADDMPRMVRGDSARTVQIFANLIANSVKFTSTGHVILRAWCGSSYTPGSPARNGMFFGKESHPWNQQRAGHEFGGPTNIEPGKVLMWFEVEDTGCGIDPSKWEAVFDSFVQADPSTTRTYGGTGLGLCIVRSLVRKMEGDIKVVKKQGPGTLLRFYLVFGTPSEAEADTLRLSLPVELENAKVLLAMKGEVGRGALTQWMQYRGLQVYEASEWDEMLHILRGLLEEERSTGWKSVTKQDVFMIPESMYMNAGHSRPMSHDGHDSSGIPDDEVSLVLSRSPDEWKTQSFKLLVVLDSELVPGEENLNLEALLSGLDEFRDQGVFMSWLLNHDTPNKLKTQLRQMGYSITANQPLYKSKLLQVLTSMVGCLERGHSGNLAPNLPTIQTRENYDLKARCFEDGIGAGTKCPELDRLQSQVQSKLNKSLPKVLEKWSSLKDLASLEAAAHNKSSQTALALDIIALHQDPERCPVPRKSLERTVSSGRKQNDYLNMSVIPQVHEEQLEMTNLGPSMSPESSHENSRPGSPHYLGALSKLSTMSRPPSNDFKEGSSIHRVVDIPLVLSDPYVEPHSRPPNYSREADTAKDFDTQQPNGGRDSAGLRHDTSRNNSTVDVDKGELIQKPKLLVDISSEAPPTESTSRAADSSTGGSKESVKSKASETTPTSRSPSEPRASTRNLTAKKPPATRLGPSNALIGIRILLAEDTPVLQKVATIMLEKMGARVVAVGDGLQAVEIISRSRGVGNGAENGGALNSPVNLGSGSVDEFDLVLMDCQMPRMDGYDATKAIRRAEEGRDWHIPIVALTAHAMSSDEAKCLQVGMDAYLTKPIDSKLMVSTILSLTKKGIIS